MKFEMTRGCICDSLTINGMEETSLTDGQRMDVMKKIFDSMKPEDLNCLLQWYVPFFGDCECDDEPCECCGDYVESFTLEI